MRLLTLIGLIYCLATAGCSKGTGENEQVRITETSKVMVKADGSIYLNKKQVSSEQLADELKRLKSVSGALWYCREFPEREPTQAQFDVFTTEAVR